MPGLRKGFPTPGVVCCLLENLGLGRWLGSRSLNPNFVQLGLLLSQASCGRLSAIWTRTGWCARPREACWSPHQRTSRPMPRVSATPANLTAPRWPRWGWQPGIRPPGPGAPHCPTQEPSVRFLPTTTQSGKGSLGPSYQVAGIPHHPEWGRRSGVPPPGCGVSTSLVGAQYGSLFSATGFPRSSSGTAA